MRLAAIGDSLTQGFQHLAIWNTEWSFPAIVAQSCGLRVPSDFRVPSFGTYGLPVNLEALLYDAELALPQTLGAFERNVGLFRFVERYLDQVEDYFERGPGSYPPPRPRVSHRSAFHNLAVWGFSVSDALYLNQALSSQAVERAEGWLEDDFFGLPAAAMYRTAERVLNPGGDRARSEETQVRALERLVREEGPLDVLIVWLGANDALRTVLDLELRDMPSNVVASPANVLDLWEWNLSSEALFRHDYAALTEQIAAVLRRHSPATKVFAGTVPDVTIPPVMRGLGALDGDFFERYTRFFVLDDAALPGMFKQLSRAEVKRVHDRIAAYNRVIADRAGFHGWHVVDTAGLLDSLAVRRNRAENDPGSRLRQHYEARGRLDHPLLQLNPVPSVLMYRTDEAGYRRGGGLIGLDGVHPTTIGYGIVAELFLEKMNEAGVPGANPRNVPWQTLVANDWLIQHPPRLWAPLSQYSEQYALLWDALIRTMT
jgi:lysophospholipase L1-like esterase